MSDEPTWKAIMRRLPFVCPKCSRRFPLAPRKNNCPSHLPTAVKVVDQTAIMEAW